MLLLQGGTQGGFAGVPLNLIGCTGTADYIVTGNKHIEQRKVRDEFEYRNQLIGIWSKRAAEEAAKYGKVNLVLPEVSNHTTIPDQSTWKLNSNASYVYYCDNETANGNQLNIVGEKLEIEVTNQFSKFLFFVFFFTGIEFSYIPETNGVPLVCDMASSIFSKPIDITKVMIALKLFSYIYFMNKFELM